MQATSLNPVFSIDPADRTYILGSKVDLDVTAAATETGGSTVYTAQNPFNPQGASNAYAGIEFSVSGFLNTVNNGLFPCTASTATTVTLTNGSGIAETPPGAHMSGWNPVTSAGAGKTWAVPGSVLSGRKGTLTWQISYINSPSAVEIYLQGSQDGVNWETIDTTTNTAGEARYVDGVPFAFLRANVNTLTGTGAGALVSIVFGTL